MKIDNKSIYHPKNLDLKYYRTQGKKTYQSTINFFNFLNSKTSLKSINLIDFACGNGSNLIFAKKKYGKISCNGIDFNKKLISSAKKKSKKENLKINYHIDDINNLSKKTLKLKCDIATIIQTLSVLDGYKKTINQIKKFNPKCIAVNSLFWDGDLEFKIKINFLNKKNSTKIDKYNNYNIYSLKQYVSFMKKIGYKKNFIKKFIPNRKILNLHNKKTMGSYTVNFNKEKKTVSGPLLLDWYFIISKK